MTRADMLTNCSKDTAALMHVNTFLQNGLLKYEIVYLPKRLTFAMLKFLVTFLDKLDWRNYLSM
jgi:hypothetical protein